MFLVHLYRYRAIPKLDEGFRRFMEDRIASTEAVIRSLQEEGRIRNRLHPRLLAGVFIGQYFTNTFLNEFLGPALFNADTVAELTRDLFQAEG